ncbi:hypothetical protein BDV28DRAFT_145116 [Aspergillus coremiiformis]|uniref:Rootletin n=1 Tax=Aspergillus coremiiformis TaxID=138285 RepID=A0A5N6ZFZ9_9EURO|nr:hypothetical protein BDV28DRAFT_145116 [Aspergillus coremiiformis]
MENESLPPFETDPLAVSHRERDTSDPNEIGDEEEVLLLQMVESNTEPVSPNLKAVLEKGPESNWAATQSHPTPSLVERPRSSGIDLTAFSFTRPAPHGKAFTLQPPTKQSNVPTPYNNSNMQVEEERNRGSDGLTHDHQSKHVTSRLNNTKSKTSRQTATMSPSSSEAATQESQTMGNQARPLISKKYIRPVPNLHHLEHNQDQYVEAAILPSVAIGQLLSPENEPQATRLMAAPRKKINNRLPQSPRQEPRKWIKSCVTERSTHEDGESISLSPTKNKSRVEKRRRANERKIITRPPALSEEDLFQLLIDKLKAREQNDAAAFTLKEQMEASISELTEENNALKGQLEAFGSEIQKKCLESKAHKSQLEVWKTKLTKFRYILNDLGSGYKALRGEVAHLNLTRTSLNKERKEIKDKITETRVQLLQTSTIVEKGQRYLFESQSKIKSMEQALESAEEKTRYVQRQLSDEKKRVDQLGMLKKLDSAFEAVGKQVEISQTTTQTILRQALEESNMSIKRTSDNYAQEKLDMQQCKTTIQEFSSQIKSLTDELRTATCKSSEVNENRMHLLMDQLLSVRESVGSDSILHKQLSTNEARCISLHDALETCVPSINKLGFFLEGLQDKENGLAERMKQLETRLSEVRIPETTEPTAAEIKERIELELKVQQLSTELRRITEENLRSGAAENEEIKLSLLEAITKCQEAEARAKKFESETITLRDEVKTIETTIREELNRASVISRDQHRAKYEQQIHELLRDKVELHKGVEKVKDELIKAQRALAENETGYMKKQNEVECLLLEKEKQIQTLESNCAEKDALLTQKDMEVSRLQEVETSITAQESSVQTQLNEANEKAASLEKELIMAKEGVNVSSTMSQAKLDILQKDLLAKEEECTRIQKELSAEVSARSRLETGKSKAKSEIYTLLRRVQDSEHWVKEIRDSLSEVVATSPKEPCSEPWNRLMALLRPAGLEGTLTGTRWREPTDGGAIDDDAATKSTSIASIPKWSCVASQDDVVQTTELIYRAQSFQRNVYTSPAKDKLKVRNIEVADGKSPCVPDSQQSTSIVPFSSIRQLSPASCSISEQDPNDIAAMLVPTPEEIIIAEKLSSTPPDTDRGCERSAGLSEKPAATRTDDTKTQSREDTPLETKDQHLQADRPVSELGPISEEKENAAATPKAVRFEAYNPTSGEKRKAPDCESGHDQDSTSQIPLIGRSVRVNRRTYSRNRQTFQVRSEEHFATQNSFSSSSNAIGRDNAGGPDSIDNKKARIPASPQPRQQKRTDSRHFDRKTSPTSLASGSSRHSSMNGNRSNNQRWPARGGRRTRGKSPRSNKVGNVR